MSAVSWSSPVLCRILRASPVLWSAVKYLVILTVLCPQSYHLLYCVRSLLVISCTVSRSLKNHLLYCVRSLLVISCTVSQNQSLVISCTVSAVSWSSTVLCPQSLVICTMSAVSSLSFHFPEPVVIFLSAVSCHLCTL
ncbi:unnamed protein product [Staurois parvus]|uniref:Uncharacterized protein n=1 Tax=Staurois parvus TaxID=386267 RepID=A0ABN9HNT6_9NEOB|nr:unnamed protein product [Staurois parvus]